MGYTSLLLPGSFGGGVKVDEESNFKRVGNEVGISVTKAKVGD